MAKKIQRTETEWRTELTPEQYHVCREKGTERAFTGQYWDTKDQGIYHCAGCGEALFSSKTKFDSGTGWPSYWAPLHQSRVREEEDNSFFTRRVEVLCDTCDSHLGHVFPDGPPPPQACVTASIR